MFWQRETPLLKINTPHPCQRFGLWLYRQLPFWDTEWGFDPFWSVFSCREMVNKRRRVFSWKDNTKLRREHILHVRSRGLCVPVPSASSLPLLATHRNNCTRGVWLDFQARPDWLVCVRCFAATLAPPPSSGPQLHQSTRPAASFMP